MDRWPSTNDDGRPQAHSPEVAQGNETNLFDMALSVPIDENKIVTRAPEEPFRLTFFDTTCLVVNRTIGTGIFSGPQEVMKGIRSPGIAILMWCLGGLYGFVGSHVYIEYGLNVPRYVIEGVEQAVPRSGGELHYLQYVFGWPRYRKGTVMLIGVMFGICFICIGNMATNCIDCALRILEAAYPERGDGEISKRSVYGIAVSIATVTCFIHAFSRRGGILLNNALALIKVCLMIAMIICTWVVAGGWRGVWGLRGFDDKGQLEIPDTNTGASGFGQAFMSVVFAFYGFYQPSYVIGEMHDPRKNLPRSIWWGMSIVSVLYIALNICYMIIVPADAQLTNNVAQEFFKRIFEDDIRANQTFNAFLAISSFGNIVVWTFTAARMKQEIAKQCFIPFATFFASNKDFSFGRLLHWLEGRGDKPKRGIFKYLNPQNHREQTPVGALVLHLFTCVILIMATYGATVSNAYMILAKLFTYILANWFGIFLSLGILLLHFRGPPATQPVQTPNHRQVPGQQAVRKGWNEMIKGTVNPTVGIVCASLYLIANLYLIIMTWVPPPRRLSSVGTEWYVVPVTAWCIIIFSALWFLGFVSIASLRSRFGRKEFIYLTKPDFDWALGSRDNMELGGDHEDESHSRRRRGGLILTREIIYKGWQAKELKDLEMREGHSPDGDTTLQASGADGPRVSFDSMRNTDFA